MGNVITLGPDTAFEEGVLLFPTKYASESLIYYIDYSALTISPLSVSLTLDPSPLLPSDLVLTTIQTSSPFSFFAAAGTSGVVYTLLFTLIDTSQSQWNRTIKLPIQ